MQLKRAYEILHTPEKIDVTYKNTPVWIESVQGDTMTAHVRLMDTTQNISVGVADLEEKGNISNR